MKYKIAIPPFHRPYIMNLLKTGHEFTIVENIAEKSPHWYGDVKAPRKLPKGVKIVDWKKFASNQEDYDAIYLETPRHICKHYQNITIPIIFAWHHINPVPKYIYHITDGKPIAMATSANYKRPQDVVIPEGFDVKDYRQRNYDLKPIKNLLVPVNGFKEARGVTGYAEWHKLLYELEVDFCGYNKKMVKEDGYKRNLRFPELIYKIALSQYMAIFQPSNLKARSFVVSEAMASKNVVLIPEPVTYKYNHSLLVDCYNAFIVKDAQDLRDYNKAFKLRCINRGILEDIGENAYHTILNKLPMKDFISNWNEFFELSINWD